ncbi:MAG TPA: PaaI family thioesterase, partial [Mycobacterium sp.]|nr:PaaI family thioesterase [Mycobacterium sp.]
MSAPDDAGGLPAIYGALADSIRRLIDISIRTEVDTQIVATAKSQIDSAAAQLSALMTPRSFGIRQT